MEAASHALASSRLVKRLGCVGYLYRDRPIALWDSGWRLFEGDETGAFLANPENAVPVRLDQMVALFPEISSLLDAATGTAFERTDEGFTEVTGQP